MLTVLIAEDHSVVRLGMSLLITDMYPDAVVAESETFDQALTLLKEQHFELLLLDIHLPGGDNLQMVEAIRLRQPAIGILVFSSYEEEIYALPYLDAGANGYVSKNAPTAVVKEAVETVLKKEKYISRKVQELMLQQRSKKKIGISKEAELSNREMEVMNLLIRGASAAQIKSVLNIRDSTVSTYKASIFKKMGVDNIIDLARKLNLHLPSQSLSSDDQ